MSSSFSKNVLLTAVGIGSIAICLIGYQHSKSNQNAHSESSTSSSIQANLERLKEIQETIPTLYTNEASGILSDTATDDKVEQLVRDFNSNKGSGTLDKTLEDTQEQLKAIQGKIELQKRIGQIYDVNLNWTAYDATAIPKATTKSKELSNLKETISKLKNDTWQTIANQYTDAAISQQTAVDSIKLSLSKMYKDGKATSEGTQTEFLKLANEVDKVKDQTIRKEFVDTLNQINTQKGYGTQVW